MTYLSPVDYFVIVLYFAALVGLGLYLRKKASASIEDYFLGGRKLPWWALGVSGMASFLDITGTMIIVSLLYMLGPRGLFIEFRGGAVLVLAIMLLWTGKWHRRSQCITGAEWMIYRFGGQFGGQFARIASVAAKIVGTIGMLAYLVKGVGLFLSMFLPFTPLTCSLIMICIATVYTLVSGFYGVVFTDLFQSGIIMVSVIAITAMAVVKISGSEQLAALALDVTGQEQWLSSSCHWVTSMPRGYEVYRHLMMIAFFYFLRNIFGSLGTGDEPKYFGARSDRECGTLTFLWTWLMMFRWPMMMAFAVLGLFLIKDLFPDQAVLEVAAELIKNHVGHIDKSRWADLISDIIHAPENYSPQLITGLQNILGQDWPSKLYLLSYEGTVEAERILPAVILHNVTVGFRGLILVALIAASMSTFDSTVNTTIGFFTRDIYQGYIRKNAGTKELIYVSWAFGTLLVLLGFLFGYTVRSINDVWDWFIMALGGGLLVPAMLKFHWWRFNGGGFAVGTVVGIIGAIGQRILLPDMDPKMQFVLMVGIGLVGSVIGTYLTQPTDARVLENFYRTTRPFGFWQPMLHVLDEKTIDVMKKEHRNDLLALPFTLGWQITLFLLPMQLLIRAYAAFGITFIVFGISITGMYFFWYRNLPPASSKKTELTASEIE